MLRSPESMLGSPGIGAHVPGTAAHDLRNRCSRPAGITAHDGPEYAPVMGRFPKGGVEVYVRDGALQEHVKAGRVQLLTETGAASVTESDIRLRFNNWDRIRAQRIPSLLSAAIGLGASGVFFLFGLLGWGPVKPVHPTE